MKVDTLGARIFLLMWLALVGSHVAAYAMVRWLDFGGPAVVGAQPPLPTFPSLPPTPGLPGAGGATPAAVPPMLPTPLLLLDYGVRLAIIAGAAWFGSRWLARPMQRLVQAASALVPALARRAAPPVLPEDEGTREVRDAAHVFNGMATRLAQQFEARGLMIAAISHDLRTPLTRMRMRLETLQAEPELRDRCIADIREMNTLIDSVLDVFRNDVPDAARRQRLDLGALLQALVDDRAETGAAVSYSGQPMVLHAEPVALRRLVGNLVDNALRYAGAAEVTALVMGDACRILVQDRGPGIPQEQLDAVLQPFVRVEGSRHRSTGGTGLGLFIARELAERLGGTLVLSNRVGGGLSAEVVLPLGEPAAAPGG